MKSRLKKRISKFLDSKMCIDIWWRNAVKRSEITVVILQTCSSFPLTHEHASAAHWLHRRQLAGEPGRCL